MMYSLLEGTVVWGGGVGDDVLTTGGNGSGVDVLTAGGNGGVRAEFVHMPGHDAASTLSKVGHTPSIPLITLPLLKQGSDE